MASVWRVLGPASVALLLSVAGCTTDAPSAAGHSHAGGIQVSLPVGDGTQASEVGYGLRDVELAVRPGHTGRVTFHIEDFRGQPVTDYVEELTQDLHLYVVRDDLEVFRHLHPTMSDDGTWSAPLSVPAGGSYRVITEFVARDDGGNGDHLILGATVPLGGDSAAAPVADPMVQVEVAEPPTVGVNGRLRLLVRDDQGRPVRLDTYLGTHGHVTGFHRDTGAMVHLHPLTAPETTAEGAELTFHTEVGEPGDYLLFVQVRVDGFLHTVPVPMTVSGSTGA